MYTIIIPRQVQKKIGDLSTSDGHRIVVAINQPSQTPRPPGSIKLTARPGYRLRVGRYRIIYDIDDHQKSVTIRVVDDRGDVYG